jgi:hypothetical protein
VQLTLNNTLLVWAISILGKEVPASGSIKPAGINQQSPETGALSLKYFELLRQ